MSRIAVKCRVTTPPSVALSGGVNGVEGAFDNVFSNARAAGNMGNAQGGTAALGSAGGFGGGGSGGGFGGGTGGFGTPGGGSTDGGGGFGGGGGDGGGGAPTGGYDPGPPGGTDTPPPGPPPGPGGGGPGSGGGSGLGSGIDNPNCMTACQLNASLPYCTEHPSDGDLSGQPAEPRTCRVR